MVYLKVMTGVTAQPKFCGTGKVCNLKQVAWMKLADFGFSWLRCPVFRCTSYGLRFAKCDGGYNPKRKVLKTSKVMGGQSKVNA